MSTISTHFKSAVHESGHIIITYVMDYSCEWAKVYLDEIDKAGTMMIFHSDTKVFSALVSHRNEEFMRLSKIDISRIPVISLKVGYSLAAGGCAEAICFNQDLKAIFQKISLGSDNLKLSRINCILKNKLNLPEINFQQNLFDFLTSSNEFKELVLNLANEFKEYNYSLTGSQIERWIDQKSNFKKFKNKIKHALHI